MLGSQSAVVQPERSFGRLDRYFETLKQLEFGTDEAECDLQGTETFNGPMTHNRPGDFAGSFAAQRTLHLAKPFSASLGGLLWTMTLPT